jgi:hypothetical protein
MAAIRDTTARRRAGLPVSEAEIEWIDTELSLSPGYSEWCARQLLDQTLRGEKAFV